MRIRSGLAGVFVLPLVGLFLGCFGGIFIWAGQESGKAAAHAEGLPALTAVMLEDSPLGREVVIEGRISDRNRVRFREFVAYVSEEYQGDDDDGDPKWRVDERVTPPLLLDLPDGRVQIENQDYTLESTPVTWQDSPTLRWNRARNEGTKRYRGFAVGNPAMAIGVVVEGQEGRALAASLLYGGTQADYVADRRSAAALFPKIGMGIAGIGVVIIGIGVWLVVRRLISGR